MKKIKFLSLPLTKKKRERERGAKAISNFKNINFKGYAEDFQGILKISK